MGNVHREFRCCDTMFIIKATGVRSDVTVDAAQRTAESLESQLDAFDNTSAVSRLNREGTVTNKHIARIVRRGFEYNDRTNGVFDILQDQVEHTLKAFPRSDRTSCPETFDTGTVYSRGNRVISDIALDFNGLAKGYIVDQTAQILDGITRHGFVSGGGAISPPTGPVTIESPCGDDKPLKILDTDWHVAMSGGYRRERDGANHVYNPSTESLGSRHESVNIVARRDCMEADALATTLAALPPAEAQTLAEEWDGLEALVIHDGVFHTTSGFETHVMDE